VILLRLLVRVVSFLLLIVLALLGLGIALSAIDPGSAADVAGLPRLRDRVGAWFENLEGDGPVATASLIAGVAAGLLGLALLIGLLVPRRERLVTLRTTEHGPLAARRRALADVARSLAEQTRGVTQAKVKVKPRRRGGGRLRVRAARPRPADGRTVDRSIASQLETLTGPFGLKASVQTRAGERGARVQ